MKCLKGIFVVLITLALCGAADRDASLDSLAEAGHWKQIREVLQQHAPGGEAEKAYWSARVKQAFGDLEGAESLARKAISLDNSKAAYHYTLSSICLDQLGNRPGMFKSMRLARDTKSELEAALSFEPKNVDVMNALMEYDWNAPSIGGGDKKMARELADRIAQANAPRGYLAQARMSELAGGNDTSKVEGLLKTAVQSSPRDYRVRLALAEFYLTTAKDYAAAVQEAKAAVPLAPDRSRAYADLAMAYAHDQKWNELDQLLAQSEKTVPEDLNPYYQAGKVLLLDDREYDRAERYLRKYLGQEPEGHAPPLAGAHWRLGLVLEKKGKKPQAIAEMQESLRLQPDFAPARKDLDRLR